MDGHGYCSLSLFVLFCSICLVWFVWFVSFVSFVCLHLGSGKLWFLVVALQFSFICIFLFVFDFFSVDMCILMLPLFFVFFFFLFCCGGRTHPSFFILEEGPVNMAVKHTLLSLPLGDTAIYGCLSAANKQLWLLCSCSSGSSVSLSRSPVELTASLNIKYSHM